MRLTHGFYVVFTDVDLKGWIWRIGPIDCPQEVLLRWWISLMMMMVSYFPLVGFFVSCNVELRLVGVKGSVKERGVCLLNWRDCVKFVVSESISSTMTMILHSYGGLLEAHNCWWPSRFRAKKRFCSVLSSVVQPYLFTRDICSRRVIVMLFLNIYFFFQFSFFEGFPWEH